MFEPLQKTTEDLQKAGQANYDAAVRAYGEASKSFQAIGQELSDYAKSSFENTTRTFEQLLGAKSLERTLEIQTNFAKTAYENWTAEVSKIGEMYQAAASEAYKPFEKAFKKPVS
jgi:hypothetical protein